MNLLFFCGKHFVKNEKCVVSGVTKVMLAWMLMVSSWRYLRQTSVMASDRLLVRSPSMSIDILQNKPEYLK